MSVSTGLHFDQCDDTVWLQITDGESLVSLEVRNPRWDWESHCIYADVVIDLQVWRLLILSGFHLRMIRPGCNAAASWDELLERFGHPMSEGVSHG